MECTRCNLQMIYHGAVASEKEGNLDHEWSCKCGNVLHLPKMKTIENNPVYFSFGEITCDTISYTKKEIIVPHIDNPALKIAPPDLAFTCQICGNAQTFYGGVIPIMICDQCKNDLKEYVLSKRKSEE